MGLLGVSYRQFSGLGGAKASVRHDTNHMLHLARVRLRHGAYVMHDAELGFPYPQSAQLVEAKLCITEYFVRFERRLGVGHGPGRVVIGRVHDR